MAPSQDASPYVTSKVTPGFCMTCQKNTTPTQLAPQYSLLTHNHFHDNNGRDTALEIFPFDAKRCLRHWEQVPSSSVGRIIRAREVRLSLGFFLATILEGSSPGQHCDRDGSAGYHLEG